MQELKVKFVDFWADLNKPEENYFYELLSERYQIKFSDDPDVLFYSCYGKEYLKYKCTRIFFSGENWRPDFSAADYAITFDYTDNPRHFRFPLWALYYNGYVKWRGYQELGQSRDKKALQDSWEKKKKFCCFIVSNPRAKRRINFFNKLNKIKKVDSAGRHLNNIGYFLPGDSLGKMNFIKDYRFVISFENESYPGYTTEKIIEPLLVDAIPIYWGNPLLEGDFNKKRILYYDDFPSEEALIDRIMAIENDKEEAVRMLQENPFANKHTSVPGIEKALIDFLSFAIDARHKKKPVAQDPVNHFMHTLKKKGKQIASRLRFVK